MALTNFNALCPKKRPTFDLL